MSDATLTASEAALLKQVERLEKREQLIFEGGYNWGWTDGLAEHYGESHAGILERFERWKAAHKSEITMIEAAP